MSERFVRQEFLGDRDPFRDFRVGVVGLSGGGSHVVQQLAHLGFERLALFDPAECRDKHLNRNVLMTAQDAVLGTPKALAAERRVREIYPSVDVAAFNFQWQDHPEELQQCDVVVGCLDGYDQREQLEAECRRHLIPYVDIGLSVTRLDDDTYSMSGQVILSMPQSPCMRCLGFLSETKLAAEAAHYGTAGDRPQVVWANGVLASTAVGLVVNLVTNWSRELGGAVYLAYDANTGFVTAHPRADYATHACSHYPVHEVGTPLAFRRNS